MGQKVRSAFGGQLPVEVKIADDANDDTPIAVDLVVVYEKTLVEDLLKMPATEWFKKKKQFMLDHQGAVEVKSWEWVPGQMVETITVEYRAGCKKVIVFADYNSEGDHRASISPQQPSRVVFKDRDFNVEAQQQ
jgi:type VI secretion system protein